MFGTPRLLSQSSPLGLLYEYSRTHRLNSHSNPHERSIFSLLLAGTLAAAQGNSSSRMEHIELFFFHFPRHNTTSYIHTQDDAKTRHDQQESGRVLGPMHE